MPGLIEFEENKVKLNDMKPALSDLRESFALDACRDELERLHAQIASDGFWDDIDRAQKVQRQASQLENKIKSYEDMEASWDDLMMMCDMALEEGDESLLGDVCEGVAKLESDMESARLETLLTGEYDGNNALLSFHAGAGGTETLRRRADRCVQ